MAQQNKKRSNKLIWWILGGAIVALLAISVLNKGDGGVGEKVYAEKVQKRTIEEVVQASGRVFPEQEVKISSDVSGEIVQLFVKEGDSVRAGQLLCRVDAEIIKDQVTRGEAGVNQSRAQYANALSNVESVRARQLQLLAQKEQAEAQLTNVRLSYKRNEQLRKDGVIADADFETAQANLRQQEANIKSVEAQISAALSDISASEKGAEAASFSLKSAEASLKELKTSLRRTSIYAPVNGVVSKLSVEKGERVVGTAQMSGTEIMRIANLNAMEVQVEVSENDIARLGLGNLTDIEVDAYPGRKFKGNVSEIANTASNAFNAATGAANLTTDQVTNFVVKVRIDAASYADILRGGRPPFRPGMSASLYIHTLTETNVLSIPIQSVTTRDENAELNKAKADATPTKVAEVSTRAAAKEVVFVVSGDTAKMVEVKSGIQDRQFIHISAGLKEGDEVIAAPYSLISRRLKNGMKVRKVSEKEAYAKKGDKKKNDDDND